MARPENKDSEFFFNTTVDDELYDELSQLEGEEIVHLAVWEDSMAEGLPEDLPGRDAGDDDAKSVDTFDIDLYLGGGVYFELYSVAAYDNPDGEPYMNHEMLEARVRKIVASGASLGEVAVNEEDSLVLVLNQGRQPALFLDVGGWVLEEWDELPV